MSNNIEFYFNIWWIEAADLLRYLIAFHKNTESLIIMDIIMDTDQLF